MAHQKCKPNCLALNEIQKPHSHNVRAVVQMEKDTYSHTYGFNNSFLTP